MPVRFAGGLAGLEQAILELAKNYEFTMSKTAGRTVERIAYDRGVVFGFTKSAEVVRNCILRPDSGLDIGKILG